ncbi:MAG TPA: integrase core domain-containing protein [Candidatus Synoicihabitans sp.]|nr:integrase core domain-containing protein [Candidatus Synoicihabitans sp.]
MRHHLIQPKPRRRRRDDYKRRERARSMELWQIDVMGSVFLTNGVGVAVVTGIDDHSRFCLIAKVVARATARPVCDALLEALNTHGIPEQILTDNGKVFTGRFGRGKGEVLFDRVCRENGIRHLLTAPHSPTTTGKVERFHKTLRAEFLAGRVFESLEQAQAQLDAWVAHYNTERPHQGIGMVTPAQRFTAAAAERLEAVVDVGAEPPPPDVTAVSTMPVATRRVTANGKVSLAGFAYHVGPWLAGQTVDITVDGGLVQIAHNGVLVATHARRHPPEKEPAVLRRQPRPRRAAAAGPTVVRKVDSSGGSASPAAATASATASRAPKSTSAWSVTRSRSASRDASSAPTQPSTTGPRSTARSPPRPAGPAGSTQPQPDKRCNARTGANP